MKRFPLLPHVALVFAVTYACTDSTAPANSHALLSPKDPAVVVIGDPPPPPADAAINVCVPGAGCAAFDGVYFSNGGSLQSIAAANEVGDLDLASNGDFNGTAWLRLNNKQLVEFETSNSANARFKRQDEKLSGMGTLVLYGDVVKIEKVTRFDPNPNCGFGDVCAFIMFDGTIRFNGTTIDVPFTNGSAEAFNREFCDPSTGEGSFYNCDGIGEE